MHVMRMIEKSAMFLQDSTMIGGIVECSESLLNVSPAIVKLSHTASISWFSMRFNAASACINYPPACEWQESLC